MDNEEFTQIKAGLEQEIGLLKRNNKYLSDKYTEINAMFHQAMSSGEHAAKVADQQIGKLQTALNQFRSLSEQLLALVPEEVRAQKIAENANILDTSKLL